MRINFRPIAFLFIALLAAIGCSEFMEEPLDDKTVRLLSPGRNAEFESYTINFMWDRVDYALDYQLQVACPSFDSVAYFSMDTITGSNHFILTLPPGRFEWRVRAMNGSSQTAYSNGGFLIHDADLSKQKIVLSAPLNDYLTATESLTFAWQPMHSATSYTLQVDTNNFIEEDEILFSKDVNEPALIYSPLKETKFQWRVKAGNGDVETLWSEVREFVVDRTAPEVPKLISPADNQQVTQPVVLKWEAMVDAASYQVYLYDSDSVTLYNEKYPLSINTNSHTFNGGKKGERLVWRVRVIDRAGNKSDFSRYRVVNLAN